MYDIHFTTYIVQCIMYIVHCTMYTVQCIMYNVHFIQAISLITIINLVKLYLKLLHFNKL